MKKILFIFCILFFVPVFAHTKIDVLKVYDGDSILAQIDNNIFRIRLIDIDCFEGALSNRAKWQAKKHKMPVEKIIEGGNLAGEILSKKLEKQDVYFEFMGIDKYSRALGVLYVDERNINKEMLELPYCEVYRK